MADKREGVLELNGPEVGNEKLSPHFTDIVRKFNNLHPPTLLQKIFQSLPDIITRSKNSFLIHRATSFVHSCHIYTIFMFINFDVLINLQNKEPTSP